MNMNELQELLDTAFPHGAEVSVTRQAEETQFPHVLTVLTPRIMVLTDGLAMFFCYSTQRDYTLNIAEVEQSQDGRTVTMRNATNGGDATVSDVPQDKKQALTEEREIFGDERLEQMRSFEA